MLVACWSTPGPRPAPRLPLHTRALTPSSPREPPWRDLLGGRVACAVPPPRPHAVGRRQGSGLHSEMIVKGTRVRRRGVPLGAGRVWMWGVTEGWDSTPLWLPDRQQADRPPRATGSSLLGRVPFLSKTGFRNGGGRKAFWGCHNRATTDLPDTGAPRLFITWQAAGTSCVGGAGSFRGPPRGWSRSLPSPARPRRALSAAE